MFTPMVNVEVVKHLLAEAKKYRVDYTEALAELDLLPEAELASISSFKYGQLYRRLIFLTGDEWLGMFAGGRIPLGAFRLMCLTLVTAVNLRQAFELAGEFFEICRGFKVRYRLDDYKGLARLQLAPIRQTSSQEFAALQHDEPPEHLLAVLVAAHQLASWLVGSPLPIEGLRLSFAAGQTLQSVRSLCDNDVQYHQPMCALLYPPEVLDLPIVQTPHSLPDFLRQAPYGLVTQDINQITTAEKVRAILNKDVGADMPSAEQIATILNVSVTTLRRHLNDEKTAYQTLKDECRLEAAITLLACRDMSNMMIAERLGFDEASAFFRAFKKWTGLTPGQYRKNILGQ